MLFFCGSHYLYADYMVLSKNMINFKLICVPPVLSSEHLQLKIKSKKKSISQIGILI